MYFINCFPLMISFISIVAYYMYNSRENQKKYNIYNELRDATYYEKLDRPFPLLVAIVILSIFYLLFNPILLISIIVPAFIIGLHRNISWVKRKVKSIIRNLLEWSTNEENN